MLRFLEAKKMKITEKLNKIVENKSALFNGDNKNIAEYVVEGKIYPWNLFRIGDPLLPVLSVCKYWRCRLILCTCLSMSEIHCILINKPIDYPVLIRSCRFLFSMIEIAY